MRRKKYHEEHENSERWLITYADLITLLLAFFILMYTMSKQDAQKYQEVATELKAIFSGGTGVAGKGNFAGKIPTELSFKDSPDGNGIKELEKELKAIKNEGPKSNQQRISLFSDERGIVVRAMEQAFFEVGKADLSDRAKKTLDAITPIIRSMPNHLRVEGHTDTVPIHTYEFRSNWELSVRRATEVVRYLIEHHKFPPDRISAVGFAEFRPIADNDTVENRAANRRIEIILVKIEDAKKQGKDSLAKILVNPLRP